jgi:segregation and condensation protein B
MDSEIFGDISGDPAVNGSPDGSGKAEEDGRSPDGSGKAEEDGRSPDGSGKAEGDGMLKENRVPEGEIAREEPGRLSQGTQATGRGLASHLEAILMVAEDPVPSALLAEVCEVSQAEVEKALDSLQRSYESERRGFRLEQIGGGWRFYSHPDEAPYVEAYLQTQQTSRLSAAALETLAIIAYKQPISRAQLAAIRGVNCDAVVRNLVVRGLVEEVGHDKGPGRPLLYGTTTRFLEQLGISSLEELPPLTEFLPEPGLAERIEQALRGGATGARGIDSIESQDDADIKARADGAHQSVRLDGPGDGGSPESERAAG